MVIWLKSHQIELYCTTMEVQRLNYYVHNNVQQPSRHKTSFSYSRTWQGVFTHLAHNLSYTQFDQLVYYHDQWTIIHFYSQKVKQIGPSSQFDGVVMLGWQWDWLRLTLPPSNMRIYPSMHACVSPNLPLISFLSKHI